MKWLHARKKGDAQEKGRISEREERQGRSVEKPTEQGACWCPNHLQLLAFVVRRIPAR